MNNEIVGYMVVRLPWASEHESLPVPVQKDSRARTIAYRGVDRMPWEDAQTELYGPTPGRASELYKQICKLDNDATGIVACKEIKAARFLLQEANSSGIRNELIAFQSELLADIKGTIAHEGSELTWLGLDVYSIGECSLIGQGVFRYPSMFREELDLLNDNGLLDSFEDGWHLYRKYRELERAKLVEERGLDIPEADLAVEGVGELEFIRIAAVTPE